MLPKGEPISLAKACYVLAGEGLLANMPPDFRDAFLALGFLRTFVPGEQVSTAGDDATAGPGTYGVVAGQVAIQSVLGAVDTPVSLLFNPGSWGGYAPLFGRTRIAHLRAIIPTTVLCVRIGDIRRLLTARPEWWQHFAFLGIEAADSGLPLACCCRPWLTGQRPRPNGCAPQRASHVDRCIAQGSERLEPEVQSP
jgi:hypothetical protein